MSLQFNDTTNYKGAVQLYERECGFNYGDVSGNTQKLKEFTADYNMAFDSFLRIGFKASKSWKLDDSNHTDYPEITANLVSTQRDYPITSDENGNLVIDIFKVWVKDESGVYHEVMPKDPDSEWGLNEFYDGSTHTGLPTEYDKVGNSIIFNKQSGYNSTNGVKVSINREASYMTYTDTTKKPGVPGHLHDYFYLKPALDYSRRNSLANYNRLQSDVMKLEAQIAQIFADRDRDMPKRLTVKQESTR